MNYPLNALFPVRERREEEIAKELYHAQHAYDEAVNFCHLKQEELTLYRQQKPAMRDQAYETVIGRDCSQQSIDKLHLELKEIEERELQLMEELAAAEQERDKRKEAVVACREKLRQAQLSLEKLKTHKDMWTSEQMILQERREESELEDHNDSARRKQEHGNSVASNAHFSTFQ